MLKIGLCGGTGAGKTEVGKILGSYGFPTINTDMLSREVCSKGSECVAELADHFGSDIIDEEGNLDRKKLASKAFLSKSAAETLNKITHPHIIKLMNILISEHDKNGAKAVFIDAPLLFESGLDKEFDYNVAVIADEKIRIQRASRRDGLDEEQVIQRIRRQKNDAFLIEHCDYYIENNDGEEKLRENVLKLLKDMNLL